MSNIYLHIPFCKQACHYCDFHFSTSLKKKEEMVSALIKELQLRKSENQGEVNCIYFGGGTPSLLSSEEINRIIGFIEENFRVNPKAEITLEANPDDLTAEKLSELSKTKINRLSIGVQSFFEEDLQLMNRAHNATEALTSIQNAKKYFKNISIDLIYAIPGMSTERWLENLNTALSLEIPHISSYALTVEPRTALKSFIEKGKIAPVNDEVASEHFELLLETMEKNGFINYEFSNFGKPDYFSQNNLAYWFGKPYLGIGPSAHSFNGENRSWNISNNTIYLKEINKNKLPSETEKLSTTDRYNEYVMTRLRTQWGVNLQEIEERFGVIYKNHFLAEAKILLEKNALVQKENDIIISKNSKFLSDGIAADLFFVE